MEIVGPKSVPLMQFLELDQRPFQVEKGQQSLKVGKEPSTAKSSGKSNG